MGGDLILPTTEGNVVVHFISEDEGFRIDHPSPDGGRCSAWVDGTSGHRITSEVPLTIEPSLNCPKCGWHRSIVNGAVV
jgi:hypothetical protein